jgi:hypothetical protein
VQNTSLCLGDALAGGANCVVEGYGALKSADLLGETIGPQQIPHAATRSHNLQRNTLRRELIVKCMQSAGTREI